MWMNPYSTIKPSTHVNLATHYIWIFLCYYKISFFFPNSIHIWFLLI
jgi:hypothetical protein